MNVAAIRAIAADIARSGQTLQGSITSLDRLVSTVDWSGPDAQAFTAQWRSEQRRLMVQAVQYLGTSAQKLIQQADDQEVVSGSSPNSSSPGRNADVVWDNGETYGTLPPEVAQEWSKMSDAERREALQHLADEYAQRYGLNPVTVQFDELADGGGNFLGYWDESQKKLVIDNSDVGNATYAINTLAHEMRHAAQHEMVRDADPDLVTKILVSWGWQADPWNHPDVTKDQAREWARNFDNYQVPDKGFDSYWKQPVEVDARTTAETEVDQMTPEHFARLR